MVSAAIFLYLKWCRLLFLTTASILGAAGEKLLGDCCRHFGWRIVVATTMAMDTLVVTAAVVFMIAMVFLIDVDVVVVNDNDFHFRLVRT